MTDAQDTMRAQRAHVLIFVERESARVSHLAARLRQHAGIAVDIVCADLGDEVELALVKTRLNQDRRISVIVNSSGLTFLIAFPQAPAPIGGLDCEVSLETKLTEPDAQVRCACEHSPRPTARRSSMFLDLLAASVVRGRAPQRSVRQ